MFLGTVFVFLCFSRWSNMFSFDMIINIWHRNIEYAFGEYDGLVVVGTLHRLRGGVGQVKTLDQVVASTFLTVVLAITWSHMGQWLLMNKC